MQILDEVVLHLFHEVEILVIFLSYRSNLVILFSCEKRGVCSFSGSLASALPTVTI